MWNELYLALWMTLASTSPDSSRTPPPAAVERSQSTETAAVNGIMLSYRVAGPADGKPILLLNGTGMQLIEWPQEIVDGLVERGYHVVLFDPRDTGKSTHFREAGVPDFAKLFAALAAGQVPETPYSAADMAADASALLDHLGIEQADLLGISGGATIAELMALARPAQVRSLNLIAANSGNPAIPLPADAARLAGLPPPVPDETRVQASARRLATARALAAREAPFDEPRMKELADRAAERDTDPYGSARQGATLLALGDLRARLAKIAAPTLVMHGDDDPLIPDALGREVAQAIPHAQFLVLRGTGHNLPPERSSEIVEAIVANAARAR